MNHFPKELNFESVLSNGTPDVVVVTTPAGTLVGHLTKGYLTGRGMLVGGRRWYVQGHEYTSFKTPQEAAWALRDYYLGHTLRERVIPQLRHNDGDETIVRAMKEPRNERLVFKQKTRHHRRELYSDLRRATRHLPKEIGGAS